MSPEAVGGESAGGVLSALVADAVLPMVGTEWHVGQVAPPRAPDAATARAARLEARLAVYAQYAAVVAEEAAAVLAGDEARRAALSAERGATAEHFAELRDADATGGVATFAIALTDALHEIRHQDAVDDALGRRLRALRDAGTGREPVGALVAGRPSGPRIDLRF